MAVISGDLSQLETALASARAKLSAFGTDVPTSGIESFAGRAKTAVMGVEAPINNLSTSFTNMGKSVASNGNAAAAALNNVAAGASTSSKSISGLNAAAATTSQHFNQIRNAISQVSPEMGRMTSSVISGFESMGVATTIAAVSIAAVGIAITKAAFDAAVEFDKASDRIRIATGAVGDHLKTLEGSFRNLFTSLPVSAADASQAIAFLSARLGETGPALEKVAMAELNLARITGASLGSQLEATTKLFKNWKISTDEQVGALDLLFRIGQQTAVSVTTLANSLVKLGPELKALGFSFQESAILIGKFEAEGISLDRMLPGLKASLKAMAKEGVTDASDAFKILIERIKDAPTDLAAVGIATKEFGRNGVEMADAIRSGRFELEAFNKQLESNHDTIAQAARDTDDFAESWKTLKNKITDALEPLGKLVFDSLSAIVSSFTEQGDQIKERWAKVWDDLMNGTRDGSKGLIQIILDADDPANNAGKALADAIHDGFFAGWNKLIEWFKSAPTPVDVLKSAFDGFPGYVADVWEHVKDSIIGPIQRALDWLQSKASDFKAAFDAITAAAKAGLIVHSPPIAAIWVMQIGNAALESAGKVRSSTSVFAEGFTSITESATAAKTALFFVEEGLSQLKEIIADMPLPVLNLKQSVEIATDGIFAQGRALLENTRSWDAWRTSIVDAASKIKDAILDSAEVIRTRAVLDINRSFDSIIDNALRLGQQMGKTGDDLVKFATESMAKTVAELKAKSPELASTIEAAAKDAVARFQKEFYKLPGALDDIFNKLAVGAKKQMSGIFEIIGALPGKFGDALRKTTNTVLDWINRIDGILKGLHNIFKSIPEGLGGVLQQVIGIFKGNAKQAEATYEEVIDFINKGSSTATKTATSTAGTITSVWGKASQNLKVGLSAAAGAFASLTSAMAVTSATGSKTAGILTSLFSSTLAGIQAGMAFGPVGGAIVGGISFLGGILGSIFGGKSALQKAQEAAALQKAKDDIKISQQNVLKAIEETKQSMIETLDKARALLESIEFYSHVPKVNFQAFFKDVGKLFNNMLDLAKEVSAKATADVKAAAENLKPVVELFAMIPQVLEGISAHLKVPDIQFDKFFADTKTLIEHLGVLLEEIPKELVKHAKKFQKALGDGLQVVPDLVTALASLFDIKSVSDQKLDIFESSLRKLTERISKIADETDKHLIKAVAFFGEKMGSGVALMKDAVDLVRALVDLPMPSDADFDHLFKSMEIGLSRAIESALAVVTDNLPLAQAIWEKTQTIVEVLKGGIEFVKGLVGIPMPSPDDFSNLFSGLNTGLNRAIEIALSIGEEALASAQAVWNRTKEIFDAVKAGVDVVKAIAETKWPEAAAWDAFLAAIDKMLTTLTASLGKMVEGQTVAAQMAAAARAIATDVAAAAASLASASGGFAGISGGLAPGGAAAAFAGGVGGFGTTSIPAGPVSFGRTAAAAPVQETTQIFLTVEGSLVHERRIQDLLVESLRTAERRGRVSLSVAQLGSGGSAGGSQVD